MVTDIQTKKSSYGGVVTTGLIERAGTRDASEGLLWRVQS